MLLRKTFLVLFTSWFLAAIPAYCQRGTLALNIGDTTDRFSSLPSNSTPEINIDGQYTIFKGNPKSSGPSVVAGGELRFPIDEQNHSKEYAVYGGAVFHVRDFTIGVDVQVRRIYLPPSTLDNQVFNRMGMELLQLPGVIRYSFGPDKRAWVQAQGEPEFTPHWKPSSSLYTLPHPNFDHAYTVRGTVGYNFGKMYYVKASYENRYFKFATNQNNPNNLYNWHSSLIMGGAGVNF